MVDLTAPQRPTSTVTRTWMEIDMDDATNPSAVTSRFSRGESVDLTDDRGESVDLTGDEAPAD